MFGALMSAYGTKIVGTVTLQKNRHKISHELSVYIF